MNRTKILILAIAGCLLVILGIFCWKINDRDSQLERKYEKWQNERRNLEVEYRNIESEIEKVDAEFYKKTSPSATVQIVFTDLDERVYSQVYPIMEKRGYVGILVFSETQLPGAEGCITMKQYEELMKNGWSTCVQWEEPDDEAKWWKNWKSKLKELNIEIEESVYFPKDTYESGMDIFLEEVGIKNVIIEKADRESPLQVKSEEGIWHIGAMGCMTTQPKKWLKEAVAQKANVAYLVSFTLEHQIYEESTFQRMLNSFEECEKAKELLVFDLDGAKKYRETYLEGISQAVKDEYEENRGNLLKELGAVEQKLEEIDAKYQ